MPASPHPTNEFAFFPDPSWTILTPENLAAMAEEADKENNHQEGNNE